MSQSKKDREEKIPLAQNINRSIARLGGRGSLTTSDLLEFSWAKIKILHLLIDGRWHSAQEIIDASEQREGLRRLRDLRSDGFEIEKKKGEGRDWSYRLVSTNTSADGPPCPPPPSSIKMANGTQIDFIEDGSQEPLRGVV